MFNQSLTKKVQVHLDLLIRDFDSSF